MRSLLPVTLITGFLGAGKTTLIYRLASARHRELIGAIVGDVVDCAIDADLLAAVVEVVEPVLPAASGRLGSPRVLRAVEAMAARFPALDRIVIETSGLDDPGPLIDALRGHAGPVQVDAVIAVVDAAQPLGEAHCCGALRQIELASQVIVSKGDLVSTRKLTRACAYVRGVNPGAEIVACAGHMLDSELLLDRLGQRRLCRETSCGGASRARARPSRPRPRPRRAGRG